MARLFRALGWPETPESDEHHRTFQCTNGVVLALYAARNYEPEFGPPADGFRGLTLARQPRVVWPRFERSTRRWPGSRTSSLLGEPEEAFWGGGFAWRDPEGNVWDVAWAKGASIDERGGVVFP